MDDCSGVVVIPIIQLVYGVDSCSFGDKTNHLFECYEGLYTQFTVTSVTAIVFIREILILKSKSRERVGLTDIRNHRKRFL